MVTPKLGFNESDNFTLVSLEEIFDSLEQCYPAAALILRIDVRQRIFFVLSFSARNEKENSGFSSVVYEPKNIQQFLSGEGVSCDYVDSKGGKISLFRHVEAKKTNNNWVWNGIKKLL